MSLLRSQDGQHGYLIIGLRQGSFLTFKLEDLMESMKKRPQLFNIGTFPVRLFLSSHEQTPNSMYALSEELWKLTCTATGGIELDHILLPRFRGRIDAFAPFNCGIYGQIGESVAIVVDSKLQVYQLDLESRKNTHQIFLGEVHKEKRFNFLLPF